MESAAIATRMSAINCKPPRETRELEAGDFASRSEFTREYQPVPIGRKFTPAEAR